jgi:hypothetical protein
MNTVIIKWAAAVAGGLVAVAVIALAIIVPMHHSAPASGAPAGHGATAQPSASSTAGTSTGAGTTGSGGSGGSNSSGSGSSSGGGSKSGSGSSSGGSGHSGSGGNSGGGTVVTSIPAPNATIGYPNVPCLHPYVWREAFHGDYVCVTTATRSQAAADDAAAVSRVQSGGGPYGKYTCKQGYVWRQIVSNDYVCVSYAVRAQAQQDNAQTGTRVLMLQLSVTDWQDLLFRKFEVSGDLFNFGGYALSVYHNNGTLVWTQPGITAASNSKPGGTFSVQTPILDCTGAQNTTDNDYIMAYDQVSGTFSAKYPIDAC